MNFLIPRRPSFAYRWVVRHGPSTPSNILEREDELTSHFMETPTRRSSQVYYPIQIRPSFSVLRKPSIVMNEIMNHEQTRERKERKTHMNGAGFLSATWERNTPPWAWGIVLGSEAGFVHLPAARVGCEVVADMVGENKKFRTGELGHPMSRNAYT